MRDIDQFTAREWLELLPLQHALKQWRNDIWLKVYTARRPQGLERFLADHAGSRDGNVAMVVAFEQPWMVDWQLRMAQRNLRDTRIFVFDNSRRLDRRKQIEMVCKDRGTPYLALPHNGSRHVNRSHGMAMNWIYYNVVRALQPRVFAYLDHDLIPVDEVALERRLGAQPLFGLPNINLWGWQLWAGYCIFHRERIGDGPYNFLYDFSRSLDTGGRNFKPLYRRYDPASMELATIEYLKVTDPVSAAKFELQVIDDRWLHIGGIGYNDNNQIKSELSRRIAQAFDEGANWGHVRASGILQ